MKVLLYNGAVKPENRGLILLILDPRMAFKAGYTANEIRDARAFSKAEERDHCFTYF